MFKLFGKPKHFFEHWENQNPKVFTPFVPESGSLGKLKLGDRIEKIEALGKPLNFSQSEKNHYTLEYKSLAFDCEDGFITYIGCKLGEIEVATIDGKKIKMGSTIENLMDRLGAPDGDDVEDLDDVILTYTRNGILIECEFGEGQGLVRINCFKE
jgi:hypothetical protein